MSTADAGWREPMKDALYFTLIVALALALTRFAIEEGVSIGPPTYVSTALLLSVLGLLLTVVARADRHGLRAEQQAVVASLFVPLLAAVMGGFQLGRLTEVAPYWALGLAAAHWLVFLPYALVTWEARQVAAQRTSTRREVKEMRELIEMLTRREVAPGGVAGDWRMLTIASLAPAVVVLGFRVLGKLPLAISDAGWLILSLALGHAIAGVFIGAWLLTATAPRSVANLARSTLLAPFAALIVTAPTIGLGRGFWAFAFATLLCWSAVLPIGVLVWLWIRRIHKRQPGADLLTYVAQRHFPWRLQRSERAILSARCELRPRRKRKS